MYIQYIQLRHRCQYPFGKIKNLIFIFSHNYILETYIICGYRFKKRMIIVAITAPSAMPSPVRKVDLPQATKLSVSAFIR